MSPRDAKAAQHLYPIALVPPAPRAIPAFHAMVTFIGSDVPSEEWTSEQPITVLAMACGCGWRSPLLETPPNTRCVTDPDWVSPLVLTSKAFYWQCQAIWNAHLAVDPAAFRSYASLQPRLLNARLAQGRARHS